MTGSRVYLKKSETDELIQASLFDEVTDDHLVIGLHSLPAAAPFYRDKCGMTELGNDVAHENLMYFEMTDKQAKRFRQKQ